MTAEPILNIGNAAQAFGHDVAFAAPGGVPSRARRRGWPGAAVILARDHQFAQIFVGQRGFALVPTSTAMVCARRSDFSPRPG